MSKKQPKKIALTYNRAVAIMKAANIVWSEMDEQAKDRHWKSLLQEVKEHFPQLAREYNYL